MNDLLDHKLKKMDHKVKYKKVPFHEERMQKAVFQGKPKTAHRSWLRKTAPVPLVALIALFCFYVSDTPSRTSIYTAAMLPEKSTVTELKTYQQKAELQSGTVVEKSSLTSRQQSSTMVRETYVIHNEHHYIQTGKRVEETELGEVVGTVKGNLSSDTPTSFFPETKIHSIKGESEKEVIAIQSRRSTGIGSTFISKQGYFVFEKKHRLPSAQ